MNPAMIITWLAGLYLAGSGHWFSSGWLHGKLALVIILSGVHGFFSRCVNDFAADRNPRSQKFYRIINEVPTILMIGIVILVVVKPF
jgi:protoporphyrinogen IX oxidase